jgi:hypothetical protein
MRYNVTSYVHCLSPCFQNAHNPFTTMTDLSQKEAQQIMTYIITQFSALSYFLRPLDFNILRKYLNVSGSFRTKGNIFIQNKEYM